MALIDQNDFNRNRPSLGMNPGRQRQQEQQQQAQTPAAKQQAARQAKADRTKPKPKPTIPAALHQTPGVTAPTAPATPDPLRAGINSGPLPLALQQPPAMGGDFVQGMADRIGGAMLNPQAPQQPAPAPIPAALQRPPVAVGSEAATMSPAEIQTLGDQRALDRLGRNHQQVQQASQFAQNPSQAGDTGRAAFDAMDPQTQGTLRQAARSNEDAARSQQNTNEIRRRLDTVRSMNAGVRPDAQGFTADERDQLGRQNFDYSGYLTPEQKDFAHRMGGGRNLAFGGPPIGQLPAALSQPADPDRVVFAQQQLARAEAEGPTANQQRFYDSVKQRAEAARPQYEAMLAREQQQRELIAQGQVRANAARGNLVSQGMVTEMDNQRAMEMAQLPQALRQPPARFENIGGDAFDTREGSFVPRPEGGRGSRPTEPSGRNRYIPTDNGMFDTVTGQYVGAGGAGDASAPQPLPANPTPDMLIDGQTYNTKRGPMRWVAARGKFVEIN